MAHPDNRYRGLVFLSREEKASRRRQNQLFIHLNKTITTSTLQDIKQLVSGVYLEDGELERCNTMSDILKALDNRCVITVGRYEKLKELLKDAGVKKLVKDVEKAEHDINEITGRALSEQLCRLISELASRYRDDLHIFSTRDLPPVWRRQYSISQPTTSTHMTTKDQVVTWKATESRHAELLKTLICGQWAYSSDEPGQREWGGYRTVIDIETLERILGSHATEVGQTAQEILASIPDLPKETLFILNGVKRPDLQTKWEGLLSDERYSEAKFLLIVGNDNTGTPNGGVKRKCNGEATGPHVEKRSRCTIS